MTRGLAIATALLLLAVACGASAPRGQQHEPGPTPLSSLGRASRWEPTVPAGVSSEPGLDTAQTSEGTDGNAPPAAALRDWDGRRYDIGSAKNPRRVEHGYVVEWDRYGLHTSDRRDRLRDPDAFSSDVVEPWGSIVHLRDFPFTNENPRIRHLTVTPAAWVFEVVQEDVFCGAGDDDPDLPWRPTTLEAWVAEMERDASLVLVMFDAQGRVVQVRPIAGC